MNFNDPEQPSHQTFDFATLKKMNTAAGQQQLSKKAKFPMLGTHHQLFRPLCLLALIAFILIFGTVSMSSTQIRTFAGFPQEILNTLSKEFESLSLHRPCAKLEEPSQKIKYYDNKEVSGTLRQSNRKARRLPIEMMKRATSNGTNLIEELQTAPLNSPATMSSPTLIPSKTDGTTSSTLSSVFSPGSQVTSLSTGSSSRSLSTVITTVISTLVTEKSSLSHPETSTGSQEFTTLSENNSGNDLSTSTPDLTSASTITRARQTTYTTTLPNGSLSTLTSTTIVQTAVEQTNSMSPTKTKETAGLQTNIAHKIQYVPFGQIIGIIAIFIANAH